MKRKTGSNAKKLTVVLLAVVALLLVLMLVSAIVVLSMYNSIIGDVEIVDPPVTDVISRVTPVLDTTTEPDVTDPQTDDPESETAETDPPVSQETEAPKTEAPETPPVTETVPPVTKPVTAAPDYKAYVEPAGWYADPIYKRDRIDPDVLNILLLGRDTRDTKYDRGRTDTMVILSYNRKSGEIKMVSVLRDTLVPIDRPNKTDYWNRCNEAYFYGGVGMCINTINDAFGLDIQNYVITDFNGVIDLIDRVGGVKVNLTANEVKLYKTYGCDNLVVGENILSGKDALIHIRNRHSSGSDFDRVGRQQAVIEGLITKLRSDKDLSTVKGFLEYALTRVSTNISLSDMLSLAGAVMNSGAAFNNTMTVPASKTYSSGKYNGMDVLLCDLEANKNLIIEFLY